MHINEKAYYAYFTASDRGNDGAYSLWNPDSNYLVVKILTTWEMYNDSDISAVDFNEFVLSFQYEVDKMKVFGARPWSVKGHLLIIKECNHN